MTTPEQAMQLLTTQITVIHQDVGDMKVVLREMTAAITKLALVEQSQAQSVKAQERIFVSMEKLENRMTEMEKQLLNVNRTSSWLDRGVVAVVAMAAMYVAKKVGLVV